ncbi:MAG TPA: FKBP-type peptidyl-prolyl cis-trans isomerase [Candidatus Angelobacter sp.]|jgi:FKBP-type peptidyl-prolyl cis-trans isomerase|nr:FKBP-type peptidyl-prolyl cis-trans isomerase [Candidatus Angelobacter sp.]
MKKSNIVMLCTLLIGTAAAQNSSNSQPSEVPAAKPLSSSPASEFKDEKEKLSYALGMRLALQLKVLRKNIDFDPEAVAQGLKDSLSNGKTRMTDDERLTVLSQLQRDLEMKEQAIKQQMAEDNLKQGEAFLAANKAREGVVTLPSGLQYKVLTQGAGPKPTPKDTVICNYRGTFIDGREFDSSRRNGQPMSFRLLGVIRGWTEALQLMPVGSKWQIFVPPSLAYGSEGHGRDIEPNAMLIFEIELLAIQNKEAEKAPGK